MNWINKILFLITVFLFVVSLLGPLAMIIIGALLKWEEDNNDNEITRKLLIKNPDDRKKTWKYLIGFGVFLFIGQMYLLYKIRKTNFILHSLWGKSDVYRRDFSKGPHRHKIKNIHATLFGRK